MAYDPKVTASKATESGLAAGAGAGVGGGLALLVVGSLREQGWALWPAALDELAVMVLAALAAALVAALSRAYANWVKNRVRSHVPDIFGLVVVMGLALGGLSGCMTTTLPDGSVVRSLDTVAIERAWQIVEETRAREGDGGNREVQVEVNGVWMDEEMIREELERRGIRVEE